ncbi:MAG TPA: glycosyltransferase family 4 protein, partial [Actinomycetota bacterium]|nr:glycosyltransferase family 4 protein [Actinomycetota bacterium]
MRLLEITNDFPPTLGGIENYIYSIVARWDPAEVVVLTRATNGCEAVDRTLDAEVRRERVATLLPTPGFQSRVADLLADTPFDLVHFASATLPLSLLGPRIRRATGIPYAVTVHGGEFMIGARLFRPLMQRALGEAAVALPVSTFTQEAVLRFLRDPPPTEVVSPGVDPARFAPRQEAGPESPPARTARRSNEPGPGPVILCVCRLVARKGPSTLIAALPRILTRHPGTILQIVGDGSDRRRLQRAAGAGGVSSSVQFVGPVPWNRLPGYYAAADLFALPTRERFRGLETEGFPLVYLEAASAGLPVVAGAAGGVGEAVADGETGIIVDGRSPDETAAAIIR